MSERTPLIGTPRGIRAEGWIQPARSPLLWVSLLAAAILLAGTLLGYLVNQRRVLSPGAVASSHATFGLKCAQCHEAGNAVTAVRCERCHDPANSERLTHSAHVLIGTGDPLAAAAAQTQDQQCQTCHREHRGAAASLRAVDDRQCGICHRTTSGKRLVSFGGHPEFAVVNAQATPGVGMKFDHRVHLEELQKRGTALCESCHQSTPDRRAFRAISFEGHCRSCHLTADGVLASAASGRDPAESESIDLTLLVPPGGLAPAAGTRAVLGPLQPDGTVTVSQMQHRDAWVLFNAQRLRTGIDADSTDVERLTLRGQIGYLESLLRVRSSAPVSDTDLPGAIAALQREISDLDGQLATAASPSADLAALDELAAAARSLAQVLPPSASPPDLQAINAAPRPSELPVPPPAADPQGLFEQRRRELRLVLDLVTARVTDRQLRDRADRLRITLDQLPPPTGDAAADQLPLADELDALEAVFRAIRAIPDAGVQAELARIDLQRRYAQQRIAAGLRPDDFEGRRRELLALLDTIDRAGAGRFQPRTAVLRQRILAIRPGSRGDAELRQLRRQRVRQLERLTLQRELQGQPADREPAPPLATAIDADAITASLGRLRATLARLDGAPEMDEAIDEASRADRVDALRSLLARCLKCHVMDDAASRLAPVRIAEPVMPRSVFNHAPHVTRASCQTCHGSVMPDAATAVRERSAGIGDIGTSVNATDVNVPGRAVCATCHAPGQTVATCATCHVYHATSPARLVAMTP